TTKVHLGCDGKGRPLSIVITPGHRHDSRQLGLVLAGIRVLPPGGRGRQQIRPDRVIANKAYRYSRCHRLLRKRQIPHTIAERRDQRARRVARRGRPLTFDKAIYAQRRPALQQSAQTVAQAGDTLGEARCHLSSDGRDRLDRSLARLLSLTVAGTAWNWGWRMPTRAATSATSGRPYARPRPSRTPANDLVGWMG